MFLQIDFVGVTKHLVQIEFPEDFISYKTFINFLESECKNHFLGVPYQCFYLSKTSLHYTLLHPADLSYGFFANFSEPTGPRKFVILQKTVDIQGNDSSTLFHFPAAVLNGHHSAADDDDADSDSH